MIEFINMIYYIEDTPNNLFFDLVPKNATTSILNALTNYNNDSYSGEVDTYIYEHLPGNQLYFNQNKHLFFTEIYSASNTINFTAIRDPYQRVVSAYLNKIVDHTYTQILNDFFSMYGYDSSVFRAEKEKYFDIFIDFIENSNLDHLDEHIKPQSKMLHLDLNMYNYIFKTDDISASWNKVMDIFPKMPNISKNKINTSESLNFINHTDSFGIERIKKIYQDDYYILDNIKNIF
jgi:hypothetical protein